MAVALKMMDHVESAVSAMDWFQNFEEVVRAALAPRQVDVEALIKECQHDARKQNIKDEHIEAIIKWVFEYHPDKIAQHGLIGPVEEIEDIEEAINHVDALEYPSRAKVNIVLKAARAYAKLSKGA